LKAQLVLELGDLRAQSRLADMAALCGAPELAFRGKSHRIFEIAQVHR
jgi:hypothetical protein